MTTQTEATPEIGHNQPDPYSAAKTRVEELVDAANAWIEKVPEITSDEQATKCKTFADQLAAEKKAIDAARKEANEPLRLQVIEINTKFKALEPFLDVSIDAMRAKMRPWLDLIAKRKAEEAARLREEAAAAQRRAEELAASNRVQDQVAAQEAAKVAETASKTAARVEKAPVGIKGMAGTGSRATSERGTWKARITDIDAAFAMFKDDPKVIELLTALGSAAARGGMRTLRGFEVYEDRKVV